MIFMTKTTKAILDGLLAGIIAGVGPLAGAVTQMGSTANVSDIGSATWLAGLLFGIVGAAKGWRSYTRNPDLP